MRKRREVRRIEIADAALRAVGEYGVEGATMERIAGAVGISAPALYKHYGGRAEILEAAMDLLHERVGSWVGSSDNPNALERLRELGTTHASMIAADYEGVVSPLFEFVAASPRSLLKEQLGRRQRETLQKFLGILEEGRQQGVIRDDIDLRIVAWSLVGLTWMENVSVLEGVDEFITDGISARMLEELLEHISAVQGPTDTCNPPPGTSAAPPGSADTSRTVPRCG